jgi:hypothetical protein
MATSREGTAMSLPSSPPSTDRRGDILEVLLATPDGLSDTALAEALGGAGAGIRPATVNALCRRMAAAGQLERVGSRPIRNRAVSAAVPAEPGAAESPEPTPVDPSANGSAPAAEHAEIEATEPEATEPEATEPEATEPEAVAPEPEAAPVVNEVRTNGASRTRRKRNGHALTGQADGPAEPAPAAPAARDTAPSLVRDVSQAWSRPVNLQASLASWLTRRGATIRTATTDGHGPARDLVASLDGDDLHVEVTGWPADGARTHPTTVAGDWFAAAEDAARARRRAHPRARVVIALPDTRRYRTLCEHRAEALAGARTEVWFVDASGAVDGAG